MADESPTANDQWNACIMIRTSTSYDMTGRKRKSVKPKGETFKKFKAPSFRPLTQCSPSYRRDEGATYKSTDNGSCDTSKKETNVYTGEQVLLGISTLHKSCLQPVFDKQTAIDNANMRRN
jgi:hypothetical protein